MFDTILGTIIIGVVLTFVYILCTTTCGSKTTKQDKKEKHVLTEHEQQLLADIIKTHSVYIGEAYAKLNEKNDKITKSNKICANCGSDKIVNKIKRIQGRIDGETNASYSSSHYLFGGYSSYDNHGSVHGELDTLGVKHCNDCGNEENYEKYARITDHDRDILWQISFYIDGVYYNEKRVINRFCKYLVQEYTYQEYDNVCYYIFHNKDKIPNNIFIRNFNGESDYTIFQIGHNDNDTCNAWADGVKRVNDAKTQEVELNESKIS